MDRTARTSLYLLTLILLAAGCSTHQGIIPTQPEVGHYSPVVVDSLYPTFRWQPLSESETLYDLAIFEIQSSGQPGRSAYYREGLKQAEHMIDQALKANTDYYWSVRTRQGTTVGD
jgi:hypothetical protein